MVCKGCGTPVIGNREYCKPCYKARKRAVSLPSEPPMETPMVEKQTTSEPKELTREEQIAALPMLPERTRYVYNRTSGPGEGMFDGRVYVLQSHEIKPMGSDIAEHLRATSIINGTLRRMKNGGGTLTAERA